MSKDKKEQSKDITDLKLLESLRNKYEIAKSYYAPIHRKMKLLDAVDRGDLWKALKTKLPPYQILPDTNFVAYVKSNLLASIYTVVKSAEVMPASEKDKEIITQLNVALECIWNISDVGEFQMLAGERAALSNIGITQVGWSEDIAMGKDDTFIKGNVVLKNINPMKFMRDPFAPSLEEAGFCVTYDHYHKSVFLRNKNYKEAFKEYLDKQKINETTPIPEFDTEAKSGKANEDYYTLFTFWLKNDNGGIDEIHTVNLEHILFKKEDIVPNAFPFAPLYCNNPGEHLTGISECHKVFANNVAFNLMDSIALTAEYKNQRPPKFISSASGLNIQSFAKHGDEADRTFIVDRNPKDAVYYHQFPQVSPQLSYLKQGLQQGIEQITGIDGRYTGRDTGSVITTGGMEEMLNRVTVTDTPKIRNYEKYTKQLTKLILLNFLEFAPKRKFYYKDPNATRWQSVDVDFPKLDAETLFNYKINISSELPNNKQRIAQTANMLMEKQMQYRKEGGNVELITEEEWLMFQDLPNKEYMLERMGIQRLNSKVEEVTQTLFQYADLVEQGMNPNDAILATANTLKNNGMTDQAMPIPGAMGGPEANMMPMGGAPEPMMPPMM